MSECEHRGRSSVRRKHSADGRSFQSLLTMSPGVLVVPAPSNKGGEISVNGQRTEANYFIIDGVSANAAGVPGYGAGYSGSAPGNSILGTTQSLVSIDALQEFRATTSTYSAEYGRMPGNSHSLRGQARISITARSSITFATMRSMPITGSTIRQDCLRAARDRITSAGLSEVR